MRATHANRVVRLFCAALITATCAGCNDAAHGAFDSTERDRSAGYPVFDGESQHFSTPPDPLPPGSPGDVIWAMEVPAPEGARAWRVLYRSRSVSGDDVAVSGFVAAPTGEPDGAGRPVVSYARGTIGFADVCAQSQWITPEDIDAAFGNYLDRNWVVAVTDYEGLGTPGRHPYMVGVSEGRSVVDMARAAMDIPETGAGTRWAAVGGSQGGHAVLWAGQIARTWAPDTRLVGVVSHAPPSQLPRRVKMADAPFPGWYGWIGVGYDAAYKRADLADVLAPEHLALIDIVEQDCGEGLFTTFATFPDETFRTYGPFTEEPWSSLLVANDPGMRRSASPVLIVHGNRDKLIPLWTARKLLNRMCLGGNTVRLRIYPGVGHNQIENVSRKNFMKWLERRFAGAPARTDCVG